MYFPLLFKQGFSCLIIGGGQVATRKVEVLLPLPCAITVIAPQISESIDRKVQAGLVRWHRREYSPGDCKGFQLVIAATPFQEINRRISEEAGDLGIPLNVVDDPDLSTVVFPAVWREKSLLVAVSTEGVAPFMAAEIRNRLASCAQGFGSWVEIAGHFREIVRKEISSASEREKLYRRFLDAGQPAEDNRPPESRRLSDWLAWLRDLETGREAG